MILYVECQFFQKLELNCSWMTQKVFQDLTVLMYNVRPHTRSRLQEEEAEAEALGSNSSSDLAVRS